MAYKEIIETRLLALFCSMLAGLVAMAFHGLAKALAYHILQGENRKFKVKELLCLHKYIDPVGLLLCVVSFAGFSKPYACEGASGKENTAIGAAGLAAFCILLLSSLLLLRAVNPGWEEGETDLLKLAAPMFCSYLAMVSMGSMLVNLFPIKGMDMGFLIAGKSPLKYRSIMANDYLLKAILIFALVIGVVQAISDFCVSWLAYLLVYGR